LLALPQIQLYIAAMSSEFAIWWSIISTILGVLLLCFSIWQVATAIYAKRRKEEQIKIWKHYANGTQIALSRLIRDSQDRNFSSADDLTNAIYAIQATSYALYLSLKDGENDASEGFVQECAEIVSDIKKHRKAKRVIKK